MDLWHKLTQWIDYNRGAFVGVVLALILAGGIIGCQPKTQSILDPTVKITAAELDRELATIKQTVAARRAEVVASQSAIDAEVAAVNEKLTAAEDDLIRQAEMQRQVIEVAGGLATAAAGGTLNAPAAVGTIVTLLTSLGAIGLGYDNLRKGRKITELKGTPPEK